MRYLPAKAKLNTAIKMTALPPLLFCRFISQTPYDAVFTAETKTITKTTIAAIYTPLLTKRPVLRTEKSTLTSICAFLYPSFQLYASKAPIVLKFRFA